MYDYHQCFMNITYKYSSHTPNLYHANKSSKNGPKSLISLSFAFLPTPPVRMRLGSLHYGNTNFLRKNIYYQQFQSKVMSRYPLTNISKQEISKKVNSCYMYSIPVEDEALPILEELVELLDKLHNQPIEEVIAEQHHQYFFTQVFPVVCQKILKSRYFKSTRVLSLANRILQRSVTLTVRFLDLAEKYPAFAQTLITVFFADEYYYKTNNQLTDHKSYVLSYLKEGERSWANDLKQGDLVDILKQTHSTMKGCWSRGRVISSKITKLKIEYLNDILDDCTIVDRNSYMIAPYKSRSSNFDWRMGLKEGDLVDCQDHYGGWYPCTIQEITELGEGKKRARIIFKVYDENGNKHDQKGSYYGLTSYYQDYDITSPKIQQYGSMVKEKNTYDSGVKISMDNDDNNDEELQYIGDQRIYAFPRKKCLSQFLFKAVNNFGKIGGFTLPIERLQKSTNIIFLSIYIKGISGVSQLLNRKLVSELVDKLKPIIERHIFAQTEQFLKDFTKERSEMLFSGFKLLQRRILTMEAVYQYENQKKMKLVDKCLQSQALKRKLQGLNELKDIVKSLTYCSERNKTIKNWIKQEKLFEKIYIINSHVQLIKKSQQFFRYLINQSILQVTDLQRLYKIAQKGDYESRISLYKLFQEVSHIFKKPHVDFLIDTILQSQLSLILNEDIDLLNQMSKFSNYFPKDKVRTFFESIILGQSQHETLYQYATKKYCQIVAKGYQMKSCRKDIIHSFIGKLTSASITQVSKVLKGIFEGIGVGQYGKKDLNEILAEQNIDEVVIQAIKNNKQRPNWDFIVTEVLNLLGFIYKLSYKVKIYISTLKSIWNELNSSQLKKKQYYKWFNQLVNCQQGIGEYGELQQFEKFFIQLFPTDQLQSLRVEQFMLMKNLILELNKKYRYITQVQTIKEAEYRRKVEMHELKLYPYFMSMIYNVENAEIYEKSLSFFLQIYNAKDNELDDISSLFDEVLKKLQHYKQKNQSDQIKKTLTLLNIIIDNSQKKYNLDIQSLITKQKSENINIIIINDLVYSASDYSKKKQITVSLNMTLYQLKKMITSLYTIDLEQIKLTQEREIPDYFNSRIIKELPINFNDPITLSRRYLSSYYEPQMLVNGKLNPKALRCFRVIFQRYSTNNLMSKQQCHDFTCACLGTITRRYQDKINNLYQEFDYDHDDLLDINGFLAFYEKAALENKGSTVWSNLKNFGVNSDFKFPNQADVPIDVDKFPRKRLSNSPQFYQTLFQLLHDKNLASLVFDLLKRLPISKKIYEQTLGIGKIQTQEQLNIETIFNFQDYYSYFYKLNIISYLSQSNNQVEKKWLKLFIDNKGVEFLYCKLKEFMKNYSRANTFQNIELQIINYSIKLLYQYFVRCFADEKRVQAINLLNYDVDIDDKIQFLVTGIFPKSEHRLKQTIIQSMYNWRGEDKDIICSVFIDFFQKIWVQWSDKIQKQHSKFITFQKVQSIICLLQISNPPDNLISKFTTFFHKIPSNKILRHLYCLILCICFYSKDYQKAYISEMFKHITLTNITSEYFRILAVLVSKFGMQEERVSEMPQILLKNILNEKNQLTIEGCAKLLSNFHLSKELAEKQVEVLWDTCLFGLSTSCKKQATRQAIYELILKFIENNKDLTDKVALKTFQTIQTRIKSIKVAYSNQVNNRSINGYAGMKNLGNICYMNSMIQQLYMNKDFRYLVMRIDDHKEPVWALDSKQRMVDDNILHQIQRIFGYLEKTTRLDFIPSAFCVAYKPFGESVNIMMQQDVQQFVSMFFDRLEQGIKNHPLNKVIDYFYTGKSTNLFSCHDCNQTKKVQENFYSLTLEVKSTKNLVESFNRFILGELISDYKCDFCQKKADVSKRARISKAPENLTLHLKRIDFNMDTFVNQKISSKHEFPTNFNLYPYSLEYYQKEKLGQANLVKQNPDFEYELTGIICHIGNAEMGHYISYIKNQQGKWFQFNDSSVNTFNPANIQAQCFGGSYTYEDQYDWDKRQNSKSAYLLSYRKKNRSHIEIEVKSLEEKNDILKMLNLEQQGVSQQPKKVEEEPTESQQESSEKVEDSEKEKENREKIQMEQIQMIRKHKSEDAIDVNPSQPLKKQGEQSKIVVRLKDKIQPFISQQLKKEIQQDNQIHFFQRCLASPCFSKFFAKLLILPQNNSKQMIKLCQKLTFGFWLKSPSFKQLLHSLSLYIKDYPSGLAEIISSNTNFVSLLIENMELDIRTNIAYFLSNSFHYYIQQKELTLLSQDQSPENLLVVGFLDNLFSLIPTTVSKCWTKFNQYFEFWYQFSKKSEVTASYMSRKNFLIHFIDYFLDKKSPLQIYKNRPTIGSTYASPNFTMLLKTIQSLLQFYFQKQIELSKDEKTILINCHFIDKLITDKYQGIAAKIVKVLCPNNLFASEKIAVVLLKGLSKSNYENVQTYLDVLHQYILISDSYQMLRIKWVLGEQTLMVSTISKTLIAMNSYSLQDRIYQFQSGLHIQNGNTLLEPIFTQNKRTENLCILCLQQLLKLCVISKVVRQYIWNLGPPSFIFGRYIDFFPEFINRYIEDAKKVYSYSGSSIVFNKQELGKNVKRLYDDILQTRKSQQHYEPTTNELPLQPPTQQQTQPGQLKQQLPPYPTGLKQSPPYPTGLKQQLPPYPTGLKQILPPYPTGLKQSLPPYPILRADQSNKQQFLQQQQKNNSDGYEYHQPIIRTYSKDNSSDSAPTLQKVQSGSSDDYYRQHQQQYYHIIDNAPENQERGFAQIQIHPAPPLVPEYVESDKQNNCYSSEEENLLSEEKKEKVKLKEQSDEIKPQAGSVYHPIKFTYKIIDEIQSGMEGVRIELHQSELLCLRTYPNCLTNKSFAVSYGHKKVSERLIEYNQSDTKNVAVRGYFVSNNTKTTIRLQTNDGSYIVRSLDSTWVWSTEILRIWVPERCFQWPQWSLYAQENPVNVEQTSNFEFQDLL